MEGSEHVRERTDWALDVLERVGDHGEAVSEASEVLWKVQSEPVLLRAVLTSWLQRPGSRSQTYYVYAAASLGHLVRVSAHLNAEDVLRDTWKLLAEWHRAMHNDASLAEKRKAPALASLCEASALALANLLHTERSSLFCDQRFSELVAAVPSARQPLLIQLGLLSDPGTGGALLQPEFINALPMYEQWLSEKAVWVLSDACRVILDEAPQREQALRVVGAWIRFAHELTHIVETLNVAIRDTGVALLAAEVMAELFVSRKRVGASLVARVASAHATLLDEIRTSRGHFDSVDNCMVNIIEHAVCECADSVCEANMLPLLSSGNLDREEAGLTVAHLLLKGLQCDSHSARLASISAWNNILLILNAQNQGSKQSCSQETRALFFDQLIPQLVQRSVDVLGTVFNLCVERGGQPVVLLPSEDSSRQDRESIDQMFHETKAALADLFFNIGGFLGSSFFCDMEGRFARLEVNPMIAELFACFVAVASAHASPPFRVKMQHRELDAYVRIVNTASNFLARTAGASTEVDHGHLEVQGMALAEAAAVTVVGIFGAHVASRLAPPMYEEALNQLCYRLRCPAIMHDASFALLAMSKADSARFMVCVDFLMKWVFDEKAARNGSFVSDRHGQEKVRAKDAERRICSALATSIPTHSDEEKVWEALSGLAGLYISVLESLTMKLSTPPLTDQGRAQILLHWADDLNHDLSCLACIVSGVSKTVTAQKLMDRISSGLCRLATFYLSNEEVSDRLASIFELALIGNGEDDTEQDQIVHCSSKARLEWNCKRNCVECVLFGLHCFQTSLSVDATGHDGLRWLQCASRMMQAVIEQECSHTGESLALVNAVEKTVRDLVSRFGLNGVAEHVKECRALNALDRALLSGEVDAAAAVLQQLNSMTLRSMSLDTGSVLCRSKDVITVSLLGLAASNESRTGVAACRLWKHLLNEASALEFLSEHVVLIESFISTAIFGVLTRRISAQSIRALTELLPRTIRLLGDQERWHAAVQKGMAMAAQTDQMQWMHQHPKVTHDFELALTRYALESEEKKLRKVLSESAQVWNREVR
ncbi:hypothetical protein FVE85_1960 [Porphyridium purpureum]|uniref:Uncharacterized protein n=1 Tax=Porphyridium purpureum TaxID=35688 RepID=A0A5J4YXD1_PORPP|nr:hypothetical protein FVE85_1960 [Porphyridium purpureum]|eukprot:POR5834..scf209_3